MQLKQLTTLASALALAACSAGPDYAPPATPSAAEGSFIRADSPAVQPLAPVKGDWWRLYNDPILDGLVRDALAHNTDVRAAVARLARDWFVRYRAPTDVRGSAGQAASTNQ